MDVYQGFDSVLTVSDVPYCSKSKFDARRIVESCTLSCTKLVLGEIKVYLSCCYSFSSILLVKMEPLMK